MPQSDIFRILGNDHPDTLLTAATLARCLHELGQHEQAHDLADDTLARLRHVLGDDHPDTLRSAHSLAAVLANLGQKDRNPGQCGVGKFDI